MIRCALSGIIFEQTEHEIALRAKLKAPPPSVAPHVMTRHLLAFWHHFSLHRITCGATGNPIVSVYDEHCPYPVWHRETWLEQAAPPDAELNPSQPFFTQLWELFQRCPIPHNTGLGNENCEYTDDWWYSKNCYLCHSGMHVEDSYYCYRTVKLKDCQYCVFSWDSELCRELLNSRSCFQVAYAISSRNCRDSAFLFDCRSCEHCLFCWNLRNKKYCIENVQYSRDEYFARRQSYDLTSRATYEETKKRFHASLLTQAYWRAIETEACFDSFGSYLHHDNNCERCFFLDESNECVNCFRGYAITSSIDCISGMRSEMIVASSLAQDTCYDIRFCLNVVQSRYLEYCVFCYHCEHCFACAGLVRRKFCIFNRQYSESEYERTVSSIKESMTREGIYGHVFPGHFAPNSYAESLASFYFPLSAEEQRTLGFRLSLREAKRPANVLDIEAVPDRVEPGDTSAAGRSYWDPQAGRPFQIKEFDVAFSHRLGVPLPSAYYTQTIRELLRWLPYCPSNGGDGLRETVCALSGESVWTTLPPDFDGRIVSQEAYLQHVV